VLTLAYNPGLSVIVALVPSSLPETSTWIMMLVGLGAMGAAIRVMRRENGLAPVR
jgi:hypothetical protein